MEPLPLMLSSFPRAIAHIDGDAFFASCEQMRNPKYRGKPLITGKERGIAASMSYEAKAMGVMRGMRLSEIKRVCPDVIMLPSDYETYSVLSKRFFNIVRRYTPDVEEYSIDECFADLTGLRRAYHMSYTSIAEKLKHELDSELGFTFSVGLAPTKVLAKLGSKWKKPSGLTAISAKKIHLYLAKLPVIKIWGIGNQTTEFLAKHRIYTALQFATLPETWIRENLTKPYFEIWQELRGKSVLELTTEEKTSYQSIQKVKTFTPPSRDKDFVFSQLSKNIENACIKARRYRQDARSIIIFLRTQKFEDTGMEVKFSKRNIFPNEIIQAVRPAFERLFKPNKLYRSTGATLIDLKEITNVQPDLFGESLRIEKMMHVYQAVDLMRSKYGKHTVFLGSSFYAHTYAQHAGERGEVPQRMQALLKGETKRRRLAIPMFMGQVK